MNTELLLSVVPQTAIWSAKTASIMITSLGHIVGSGAILGFAYLGLLS